MKMEHAKAVEATKAKVPGMLNQVKARLEERIDESTSRMTSALDAFKVDAANDRREHQRAVASIQESMEGVTLADAKWLTKKA